MIDFRNPVAIILGISLCGWLIAFDSLWGSLLGIVTFISLLRIHNARGKRGANGTNNQWIKDIMAKDGYVLSCEDDYGNLSFEKVENVSKRSMKKNVSSL